MNINPSPEYSSIRWASGLLFFGAVMALTLLSRAIDPLHVNTPQATPIITTLIEVAGVAISLVYLLRKIETALRTSSLTFHGVFVLIVRTFFVATALLSVVYIIPSYFIFPLAVGITVIEVVPYFWLAGIYIFLFWIFHNDRRVSRSFGGIAVCLMVASLAWYLPQTAQCSHGNDVTCLAKEAVVTHDLTVCDRAPRYTQTSYEGMYVSACLLKVQKTWEDLAICQHYTIPAHRDDCIGHFAVKNSDPTLCDTMTPDKLGYQNQAVCRDAVKRGIWYPTGFIYSYPAVKPPPTSR